MLLLGYLLLTLVIAAVLFYAVVALLPAGLSVRAERDNRPFVLPADRRMRADDLELVRIPVSLRGYRFAETDDLIDRLAAEIVVRDEEIARLREGGEQSFERYRPVAETGPAVAGADSSVDAGSELGSESGTDGRAAPLRLG